MLYSNLGQVVHTTLPRLGVFSMVKLNRSPTATRETDNDLQAIGPALLILELNAEGLSATRRKLLSVIAEKNTAYANNSCL